MDLMQADPAFDVLFSCFGLGNDSYEVDKIWVADLYGHLQWWAQGEPL